MRGEGEGRFQGGRDTCICDYIHYDDDDDVDDDDDDDDDDDPPLSKVRTWTSCEMVNYWFFDCLPQQVVNFYATTIKTNLQQQQSTINNQNQFAAGSV